MASANHEINSAATNNTTTTTTDSKDNNNKANDTIVTLTRGLSIRGYRWTDVPTSQKYCNNKKMWINMFDRWPIPYDEDAAHNWVNICRDKTTYIPSGNDIDSVTATKIPTKYVIALDDVQIGSIGIVHEGDVMRRCLKLGYWIGEEHWSKGYASEAVRGFVAWLWTTFGWLVRIEAAVYAWNDRYSGRVLEKAGFTRLVTLRGAVYKNGVVTDLVLYEYVREGLVSTLEENIR